eukprot:comp22291_c1_seq1/m.33053 comp22291_c1_seq1/g.33053  ORF comp22291_c1_seq1/g.33053 comp22291_c1_seq1/m.33053 type:complete len:828 (-) comp22291_c1_seq1:66-2549(-)
MATLKQVGSTVNFKKTAQEGMYARWEISAPLTERQSDLVMDLAAVVAEKPLPAVLPRDVGGDVEPLQRVDSQKDGSKDSLTVRNIASAGDMAVAQGDAVRIDNSNQFFTWFAQIEAEMDLEQEAAYRQHLAVMRQYLAACNEMVAEVDETLAHLDSLGLQYEFVSNRTESLHTACEQLLADQTRLVRYADAVGTRLQYFVELERLTLRLNSPTLTVASASFIPLLRALDSSLSYIAAHREYKDSAGYLLRLTQLQNKALVLVKMHTVDALRKATADMKDQLAAKGADTFTVLYAKFGTRAPSVKALMDELEQWGSKYAEYQAVLYDSQACYFAQRLQLVTPIIHQRVLELNVQHAHDLPTWLRTGCAFLQRICQNEYQLYHRFFSTACDGLGELLEGLTDVLYDHVRPLLIKLTDVHLLAELCDILATEILSDLARSASNLEAFSAVVGQILEDLQGRLVYRAQSYLQTEVGAYRPTAEDLAYPEKLQRMGGSNPVSRSSSVASTGPITRNSSMADSDLYSTWYPPMHRTLMCLSMLYRCIEKGVFEGISNEAITLCRKSLEDAARQITEKKSKADGQLFLIKHLLTLREQLAPFDVDFVLHEHTLDFNSTRNAVTGLWTQTSRLFALGQRNAMLRFLLDSAPTVREQRIDSKKDLDQHLKEACEGFITSSASHLIGPVSAFLQRVADYAFNLKDAQDPNLSAQQWARPETVRDLGSEALRQLKTEHPKLLASMALYLRNRETEFILFKPIKGQVMEMWRQLHRVSTDNYSEEEQLIMAIAPTEQLSLIMAAPSVNTIKQINPQSPALDRLNSASGPEGTPAQTPEP